MPRRFAFLDHPLPLAFAHRGGALEAEENTLEAFARAAALGFTHVETDVQATRDGAAVLFHDDTLERMTGAAGRLEALGAAEVAALRTRGGARLPLLEELLGDFPRLFVNIEAKSDAAVHPIAAAIRRCNALERVCVGAFSARRTRALRALLGPELATSPAHAGVLRVWLAGWGLPLAAPDCAALQVPERFRGIAVVTPRMIRAAHARGLQVHVWTVDAEADMVRLLDMGVDGLMTDRPSLLKSVLQRRGCWGGG